MRLRAVAHKHLQGGLQDGVADGLLALLEMLEVVWLPS